MGTDLLLLAVGLTCLYFGAEWLVRGSSGLATAFGVRPIVVGLTVVAYGTSAPEMIVESTASFQGKSPIVLGDCVGSNIANLGLILGLTALIRPLAVEGRLVRREVPIMILSSALVPLFLLDGVLSRLEAAGLLAMGLVFTWATLRSWGVAPGSADPAPEASTAAVGHRGKLAILTALGLGVLLVGGRLFVDGASDLAIRVGVSQRVVGLTIVAVGTSLPELATSIIAVARGMAAIAVGNLVGSNIFNVLFVLGVAGSVRPVPGSVRELQSELIALGAVSLLTLFSLRGERRMPRWEGAMLVAAYATFVGLLVAGR